MLICYFFQSAIQCLLITLENVSGNPGCESFTLKHDGRFDLNVNMKEVLDIDMPTCDLFPVKMNTGHYS